MPENGTPQSPSKFYWMPVCMPVHIVSNDRTMNRKPRGRNACGVKALSRHLPGGIEVVVNVTWQQYLDTALEKQPSLVTDENWHFQFGSVHTPGPTLYRTKSCESGLSCPAANFCRLCALTFRPLGEAQQLPRLLWKSVLNWRPQALGAGPSFTRNPGPRYFQRFRIPATRTSFSATSLF
jgi:hypothetical protein